MSRGQAWFDALSTQELPSRYRSVAIADSDLGSGPAARLLAVVPDPGNVYPRARRGEVGLLEGIGLAHAVREVIELDRGLADDQHRPIVAVVDVPSRPTAAWRNSSASTSISPPRSTPTLPPAWPGTRSSP